MGMRDAFHWGEKPLDLHELLPPVSLTTEATADLIDALRPIVVGLADLYSLCLKQGLPEEVATAYVKHVIWAMSQ